MTTEAITTPVTTTLPTDTNTGATLVTTPPEPVVAPAEIAPVVAAPEPIAEPVKAETLIADGIDKRVIPKVEPAAVIPAEVPEVTKTEGGLSEETALPPKVVYDSFVMPEGVTLDTERVGKFTDILAELETTGKVDHQLVQQFGQKAVDFHVSEVKNAVESVTKLYQDTWNTQVKSWKDDFLADPVIGGNRFQTTVDSALDFIRTHGGTAEEQKEFRDVMESSGLGNHRAVLRILANAGRAMGEGTPLAATRPVTTAPKSKVETLYGAAKK